MIASRKRAHPLVTYTTRDGLRTEWIVSGGILHAVDVCANRIGTIRTWTAPKYQICAESSSEDPRIQLEAIA